MRSNVEKLESEMCSRRAGARQRASFARSTSRFALASSVLFALSLLAACGGEAAHFGTASGGSASGGEPSASGGSASGGEPSASGGSASGGEPSASGGSAGSNFGGHASGGEPAFGSGGAPLSGGFSNGGSLAGGATGCLQQLCNLPDCTLDSTLTMFVGDCCASCVPNAASCASVDCTRIQSCPAGFLKQRERGACCDTCVPGPNPRYPDCSTVDCAPSPACPLGYHHEQPAFRCCDDCVPDPNFCASATDCMIAHDTGGCSSCDQVVSTRFFDESPCYASSSSSRVPAAACGSGPPCLPPPTTCSGYDGASCSDSVCVGLHHL